MARDFCNSPLALKASCQGLPSTAGSCSVPCSCSGQSPWGTRSPCTSRRRSSRRSCRLSTRSPLAVQCAARLRSPSRSLPSRRSWPSLTSPSSMANGRFSAGSCSGPPSGLSSPGAEAMSIRSACRRSTHKVARSRQVGDQSSCGACTSTRSSPAVQRSWLACQLPPRRPEKSLTCSPGTRLSTQRLPPWVPSTRPNARTISNSKPSNASRMGLTTRVTAQAPWRSANENHRRHPGRGPGPGAAAPPATPSARRCRRRS